MARDTAETIMSMANLSGANFRSGAIRSIASIAFRKVVRSASPVRSAGTPDSIAYKKVDAEFFHERRVWSKHRALRSKLSLTSDTGLGRGDDNVNAWSRDMKRIDR